MESDPDPDTYQLCDLSYLASKASGFFQILHWEVRKTDWVLPANTQHSVMPTGAPEELA